MLILSYSTALYTETHIYHAYTRLSLPYSMQSRQDYLCPTQCSHAHTIAALLNAVMPTLSLPYSMQSRQHRPPRIRALQACTSAGFNTLCPNPLFKTIRRTPWMFSMHTLTCGQLGMQAFTCGHACTYMWATGHAGIYMWPCTHLHVGNWACRHLHVGTPRAG